MRKRNYRGVGLTRAAVMILMAAICVTDHEALADGCQMKRAVSLDLTKSEDGRLLVPVSINDQPLLFLLDTGSSYTSSVFSSTVAALGLHPVEMRGYYVNIAGSHINQMVVVNSFAVGRLHTDSARFLVSSTARAGGKAAGLFGPDNLRQFDLEVDPSGGKVNLFLQDHCPQNVVYWAKTYTDAPITVRDSGHVFMQMMLDGKPIDVMIDTGSSATYMSLPAARRVFDLGPGSAGVTAVEPPPKAPLSSLKRYHYRFNSLSVAGIAISHPEITLLEDKMQKPQDLWNSQMNLRENSDEETKLPDMILGMNVLNRLHFYIAYGEKRFYATGADAKLE